MEIIPVNTAAEARQFVKMPVQLYRDDPNYIRPLNKDVEDVFDPKKNKAFRHGKVQRWLLKKNGSFIGRIAAFTNSRYKNKGDDVPVGCMGFFECINDQQAANLLLDTAKNWLMEAGMEAMDGPVNFGERDRWWGLVTEGFTEPLYCMNYNPPYYQQLLEQYGFQPFYHQICLSIDPKAPFQERIWKRHAEVAKHPGVRAERIRKNKLDEYAKDFATVYNAAWAGHGGMKQLSVAQVKTMFRRMKPVMDENILWITYEHEEPVGIFLNLPDLNQWFKYLNGKFGLLQKLKFLWLKKFRKNDRFVGLVFGVVPKWQGRGMDAYIIGESGTVIQSDAVPYTRMEMQWIGDFNPKMINVAMGIGDAHPSRKLTTYRYLFNRSKAFSRHPILA